MLAKPHDMTLLNFAVIERKHFGQNDSTFRNRPSLTMFISSQTETIFYQLTLTLTALLHVA